MVEPEPLPYNFILRCCAIAQATYLPSVKNIYDENGSNTFKVNSYDGFFGSPTEVISLEPDPLDRALVGIMKDEKNLETVPVIGIRGTKEKLNWVQNFDITQVESKALDFDLGKVTADNTQSLGRVHSGFQGALERLVNFGLLSELKSVMMSANLLGSPSSGGDVCVPNNVKNKIVIVGHSKGGGMALQLAHMFVRAKWEVKLVTFGAPPSVDTEVCKWLNGQLQDTGENDEVSNKEGRLISYRVVNTLDVVPRSLDFHPSYAHFGMPTVLDSAFTNSFCGVSMVLKVIKDAMRAGNLGWKEKIDRIVDHHLLEAYHKNLVHIVKQHLAPNDLLARTQQFGDLIECGYDLVDCTRESFEDAIENLKSYLAPSFQSFAQNTPVVSSATATGVGGEIIASLASFNPIQAVLSLANLGVACVILYKVNNLENIMNRVERGVVTIQAQNEVMIEMLNEMNQEMGSMKGEMKEGFAKVLEAIRDITLKDLVVIATNVNSATLFYQGANKTIAPRQQALPHWITHHALARSAFGSFVGAMLTIIPEKGRLPANQQPYCLWLLKQAVFAAILGIHVTKLLVLTESLERDSISSICDEFYWTGIASVGKHLGLAPLLGRLIIVDQIPIVHILLPSVYIRDIRVVSGVDYDKKAEQTLGMNNFDERFEDILEMDEDRASPLIRGAASLPSRPSLTSKVNMAYALVAQYPQGVESHRYLIHLYNQVTVSTLEKNEVTTHVLFDMMHFAAVNGSALAQHEMGSIFQYGKLEVLVNHVSAIEWYRKASYFGNVESQFALAEMLRLGEGADLNNPSQGLLNAEIEAAHWYRQVAQQGIAEAQFRLGDILQYGKGVPEDHEEAIAWYNRASQHNHVGAQYRQGELLLYKHDYVMAAASYLRAASKGHVGAQYQLGDILEYGRGGVKKNEKEAAKWYLEAAKKNHVNAQYHLAEMLQYGKGVEMNQRKALAWYQRAADEGHEHAKVIVSKNRTNGNEDNIGDEESEANGCTMS